MGIRLGNPRAHAGREGNQLLRAIDAHQLHPALDERRFPAGPPNVMLEYRSVLALRPDRGANLQMVTMYRTFPKGERTLVDDEPDALFLKQPHELRLAQQVLSRPLKIFQVVCVVNDAGVVGVLVVDVNSMDVHAPP